MKSLKLLQSVTVAKGFKNTLFFDLISEKIVIVSNDVYSYSKKDHIVRISTTEGDLLRSFGAFIFGCEIDKEKIEFNNRKTEIWEIVFLFLDSIIDISNRNSLIHIIWLGNNSQTLNIRFLDGTCYDEFITSFSFLQKLRFESLIIEIDNVMWNPSHLQILANEKRLILIKVHNSPCFKHLKNEGLTIVFINKVFSNNNCGIVCRSFFCVNRSHVHTSLTYNSCLFRKISIDTEGNIKNCPSMTQSFGNIKDTTLQEALDHPDFKKYWNIKKDDITKCKDCEFRYICTDCRAYIDDPEDIYSAPLKCGYDPYKGVWEEWSTNPLKQKAIDFYGMREILNE